MDKQAAGQACVPARGRVGRGVRAFLSGVLVGAAGCWILLSALGVRPTLQRNQARPSPAASAAIHPWAEPLDRPGLANLFRVSGDLYRGQQPDEEGFRQLKAMGIRTVVNLRSFHGESDKVSAAGLGYEHIYMKAWHPENEDVVRFLKIATDRNRTPVFVHCQHGSDRTGTMCAVYRVIVQGWSRQEAIDEMTHGGFGFHEAWQNLVDYINNLDVEAIHRQVGLPATNPDGP